MTTVFNDTLKQHFSKLRNPFLPYFNQTSHLCILPLADLWDNRRNILKAYRSKNCSIRKKKSCNIYVVNPQLKNLFCKTQGFRAAKSNFKNYFYRKLIFLIKGNCNYLLFHINCHIYTTPLSYLLSSQV